MANKATFLKENEKLAREAFVNPRKHLSEDFRLLAKLSIEQKVFGEKANNANVYKALKKCAIEYIGWRIEPDKS